MMLIAYVILPGRCEILHMYAVIPKQTTGSKAEDRRAFLVSWVGSCIYWCYPKSPLMDSDSWWTVHRQLRIDSLPKIKLVVWQLS